MEQQYGCNNYTGTAKQLSFFRFPREEERYDSFTAAKCRTAAINDADDIYSLGSSPCVHRPHAPKAIGLPPKTFIIYPPPKSLFAQKRHFITYCKFQIIYSGKTMSIYHVYTRSRPLCQASGLGCRRPHPASICLAGSQGTANKYISHSETEGREGMTHFLSQI